MPGMEQEQDAVSESRSGGTSARADIHELRQLVCRTLPEAVLLRTPEVTVQQEGLLIVLYIEATIPEHSPQEVREQLERQILQRHREETRRLRVRIGRRIERDTGLVVSWGMQAGETRLLFTHNTQPVMTRLTTRERQVLDILVDTNIARTRSAALSYLVRLFARDYQDWLDEAQAALSRLDTAHESLHPQPHEGPPPPNTFTEIVEEEEE